ncbi:DNA repair protein [Deinococcus radiotolerans]|uniref:DNA repair protein PprA n=1 Tax=Deinococcus radiotolerans TaxID=1309407 RepID=A0ABQ2FIT8_9DEIO|nr:DNA repair protein [Deinococcus radiotolerans]GGL00835.1 DNA repair protein PprA [Deinococcus radiotolerans]
MARTKTKTEAAPTTPNPYRTFDALMATAAVDSQIEALAESGADRATLDQALTQALQDAQRRWGLGLHHLTHAAQTDGEDITLLVDARPIARLSEGSAPLADAYSTMRATDETGLSLWGALPDGHRVPADAPAARLKVLIEDARDFETLWTPARGDAHHRTWRSGDTLYVEVARPASAEAALSDAAWDVITSIRDRVFQRELMRRSEEVGMLGALLGARHAGARSNLNLLPDAHFTVQATVHTAQGPDARNAETHRALLRAASAELDELQSHMTKQLATVLRHGLNNR